jgi:hypothetical protein
MPPRVTLLTDFGTRDGYVAAVKGVISAAVPGVLIDDVSHDIARGDVRSVQYALARYWRLYAKGTVHVVVVDPGVGTARRALACEADGRFVVCPDNGALSRVLVEASTWRAVEITDVALPSAVPMGRSATFHGRDLFAPAAADLALGRPLGSLGESVEDPVRFEEALPTRDRSGASGVVVAVDHFGNLLTNLPGEWLSRSAVVRLRGRTLRVVSTYGEAGAGELVAVVGSDGRVEVALRDGSAAHALSAGAGTEVNVFSAQT